MPKPRPFIIEVKTDNLSSGSSGTSQFTIPTTGTGYSYTVRTTNGVTSGNTGNVTITWPTPGTYEVEIYGNFPRIYFNLAGDRFKMLKVKQWGTNKWATMNNAFLGCANMDVTAIDTPDLSLCTSLFQTFSLCTSLLNANSSISNWNVSTIDTMSGLFSSCTSFNKPLNNWNTSNVVLMNGMFQFTSVFNQNIGAWNVSKVITFLSMFQGAKFNNGESSDINNWSINTIGSVNMTSMFQSAPTFNQPVGNWDVSGVTNLNQMFQGATLFNQDIRTWNVSNVTTFNGMFSTASSFNRNLGAWQLRLTGTSLSGIFGSSGMSAANYTDTIVGWANYVKTNSGTPANVAMDTQSGTFHGTFQNSRPGAPGFLTAGAARTYLTSATPEGAGWNISYTI